MVGLIAVLIGGNVLWFGVAFLLIRGHLRTYDYAVRMAERLDIPEYARQAYSDMATVITLDGKCEEKEWSRG